MKIPIVKQAVFLILWVLFHQTNSSTAANFSFVKSFYWMNKGIQLGAFDLMHDPTRGLMHNIFAFTYNSSNANSTKVPDQLDVQERWISSISDGPMLIKTSADLVKMVEKSNIIKVTVPDEVDTIRDYLSVMYLKVFEDMLEKKEYMVINPDMRILTYRMRLKENIKLEPNFLKACQKAAQNESTFDKVIAEYGTHYISSLGIGGKVDNTMHFSRTTFNRIAAKSYSIAHYFVLDYVRKDKRIIESTHWNRETVEDQRQMTIHATRECNVIGGSLLMNETPCDNKESAQRWIQDQDQRPWIISVTLKPIYELPPLKAYLIPLKQAVTRNLVTTAITRMTARLKVISSHDDKDDLARLSENRQLTLEAIEKYIGQMKECLNGLQFTNLTQCIEYIQHAGRLERAIELLPLFQLLSKQYSCGIDSSNVDPDAVKVSTVATLLQHQVTFVQKNCTTAKSHLQFYSDAIANLANAQKNFLQLYKAVKMYANKWPHSKKLSFFNREIIEIVENWQNVLRAASECDPMVYSVCGGWCKFVCMFDISKARKECEAVKDKGEFVNCGY